MTKLTLKGYTIERYIHGMEATYNNVQPWKYRDIPAVFGATSQIKTYSVKTPSELGELFKNEEFAAAKSLQVSQQ